MSSSAVAGDANNAFHSRLSRGLALFTMALSGAVLITLVVLFVLRIPHPYDIEWMEGLVVDHIVRVMAGEPLYVRPSIQFTPLIYPPLFYYVSAAATTVLGEGLLAPRIVSALSSIGCLTILFLFAKREAGRASAGVLAAGLYAASFEIGGGWLDLARIDNLFMVLLLWGCYLLRFSQSSRSLVPAGLLVFLAAMTKQPAIFVAGPVCLYLLVAKGLRPALIFGLAFAVPLLASAAYLDLSTDGWHTYYVYQLPGEHKISPSYLGVFFFHDLLNPLPFSLAVVAAFLTYAFSRLRISNRAERDRSVFFLMFCPAMMMASAASRIHVGGADNVLLPTYSALALAAAVGGHVLIDADFSRKYAFAPPLVWGLLATQLLVLAFDPRGHLPDEDSVRSGDRFVEVVASIEGDVFTPDHGYLGARVGKKSYAHYVPLWDVMRGKPSPARAELRTSMLKALRRHEFDAIVIHKVSRLSSDLRVPVLNYYRKQGMVLPKGWNFSPLGVKPGNAVRLVPRKNLSAVRARKHEP